MEEIKKLVEQTQNAFVELKKNQEEAEKNNETGSAELNAKLTNIAATIADNIEKSNLLKAQVDKVEAFQNGSASEVNQKEEATKEYTKLFNDYIRKAGEQNSFESFLKANTSKEQNAFISMSNPAGGFSVLPESLGLRTTRAFETSPMRQLAMVSATSSDRVVINLDDDDIDTVETLKETETPTASDTPDTGRIIIPVHMLGKKISLSMEQLEDPDYDVVGFAREKISKKIARVQNTAFVSGTGAAGAKGFLQYAASTGSALTVASSYTRGTLQTFKTGSAGSYTVDDIIKLTGKVFEDYQANSKFLLRRDTFVDLIVSKAGDGHYLFNRSLDKKPGVPFDILGYPIVFAADMPAIATDALAFAFGDFSECYQVVDRVGLKIIRDDLTSTPNTIISYFVRFGGGVYGFDSVKLLKLSA